MKIHNSLEYIVILDKKKHIEQNYIFLWIQMRNNL